jgi:ubiquinone/menaquinone biosynthesis C-methylase UbiE
MASTPRWQQVSGNAAEVYARQLAPAMFAPWAPRLVDAAGVRTGEHVLDVACGTGVVAVAAAERVGSSGRVVGLDINGAMLAVARSLPPVGDVTVEWVEASALDVPFSESTFDVVLCQHGLQQFPDRSVAVREMHRVLKSGGRLAANVWSRIDGSPGMMALVQALEQHVGIEAANNRRAPFALGDADELRRLCEEAGFNDVSVNTVVETARFASPEALVEAQLGATPLSTLGTLNEEAHQAVLRDVRAALQPYLHGDDFAVPMEAHVVLARR